MQEPPTENIDPRFIRSRKALQKSLLELLEIKTLEQITIRDIVAKAGIGYTTFFRHYPTKEALLNEVAAEQIGVLFHLSLPVMDAQDLRAALITLLSYVDKHRDIWSILLTGGAASTVREEFLRLAKEAAVNRTKHDSWLPPDAGIILVVSGILELTTWWLRQPEPLPIERIAEILDRLVVSPAINAADLTQ